MVVLKLISCRINSIDKSRLSADSYSYSGNGIAWKARVILFVGFALMAGGLAGAVTVLVLKYLVHDYPFPTLGFGVSNVVANALVMLRYLFFLLVLSLYIFCLRVYSPFPYWREPLLVSDFLYLLVGLY